MRSGGGKQKGNKFELKLARMLSVWWNQTDADKLPAQDLWFRRVPMSGGFDKRKAGGDIWSVTNEAQSFPFSLEAKNREEWSWDGLFKGNRKWPVWGYWEQCCGDAIRMDKIPLLVFTKNHHPEYFCLPAPTAKALGIGVVTTAFPTAQVQVTFGLFSALIVTSIVVAKMLRRIDYVGTEG